MRFSPLFVLLILSTLSLSACGGVDRTDDSAIVAQARSNEPISPEDARKLSRGKLTGDKGLVLGGGDDDNGGNSPIGVNSFLWQGTLDTLSFMPLASADPFGGVVITEWYEDPKTPGERFKMTVLILDRRLRADAVKVSLFKQRQDGKGEWRDQEVNPSVARDLEDTILTRARELRVAQSGK